MDESISTFTGILLLITGFVIVYESIALRLIDLILIIGILIIIYGIYRLLVVFFALSYGRTLSVSHIVNEVGSNYHSRNRNHYNLGSNIKTSVLSSSGIDNNRNSPVLRTNTPVRSNKPSASLLGPNSHKNKTNSFANPNATLDDFNSRKSSNRSVKKNSPSILPNFNKNKRNENPKAVLKTRHIPVSEFNQPVEVPNENSSSIPSPRTPRKSYNIFSDDVEKSSNRHKVLQPRRQESNLVDLRDFTFTPNYEKPMRVNRRPRRKVDSQIDLNDIPQRKESRNSLLANLETVDEIIEKSQPKTYVDVAKEVIVPIHDDYEDYDVPYDEEFVIDNLDTEDEFDMIGEDNSSKIAPIKPSSINNISDLVGVKEPAFSVDPNDPESLPIPKLLNSYVICEKGILTSKDAFEEVATHAKSEILLEAPDITQMGDVFLAALADVDSRIIIPEFDSDDLPYVLLIISLMKSGIKIRTLPSVESFNLIGDLSHALIISNNTEENYEYGAVYDDEDSVRGIKELFEESWDLAKEIKL